MGGLKAQVGDVKTSGVTCYSEVAGVNVNEVFMLEMCLQNEFLLCDTSSQKRTWVSRTGEKMGQLVDHNCKISRVETRGAELYDFFDADSDSGVLGFPTPTPDSESRLRLLELSFSDSDSRLKLKRSGFFHSDFGLRIRGLSFFHLF